MTRRRVIGLLGAGVIGGGGWLMTQRSGDGDSGGEADGGENDGGSYSGSVTMVGQDGEATDLIGQDEVDIEVGAGPQGFRFDPADIRIDPGTTVRWVWTGRGSQHNVIEADDDDPLDDPSFESELTAEEGFEFTHTFEEPGTYDYVCSVHIGQDMIGQIRVV